MLEKTNICLFKLLLIRFFVGLGQMSGFLCFVFFFNSTYTQKVEPLGGEDRDIDAAKLSRDRFPRRRAENGGSCLGVSSGGACRKTL